MKLDKKDRLIIANQLRILEATHPKEAERYAGYRKALEDGYELHYAGLFECIADPMPPEDSREVQHVLEMFSQMKLAFERIGKTKGIKKDDVRFAGFDPGTEAQPYAYARYLIEDLGRYDEIRDKKKRRDFESTLPTLPMYRRMLEVWKALDDRLRYKLDRVALAQIIDAKGWADADEV